MKNGISYRKGGSLFFIFLLLPVLKLLADPVSASEERRGYLHYDLEIDLTVEEQEWLDNHKSIRVSGPLNFPPFHYFNDNSIAEGIASEYMKVLFHNLNIEMITEPDLSWPEVLNRTKEKELDIISCSAKSVDREEYLLFTTPHLSFPLIIISRDDSPFIGGLEDLENLNVALVRKNIISDWLERDNITVNPYPTENPMESLEAVSLGEADAYIGNLATCSYLIHKKGLANLKVAAPTDYGYYNLYIAVRDDWPELVSILNKGLESISSRQHSEIRNEWLSIKYEHGIRMSDIIIVIVIVLGISGMIVSYILQWNRKLSREITKRKKSEKELMNAIANIETLTGLLPICAKCKNVRDDKGYWKQIEEYFEDHSELSFSHSLCPDCYKELYGDEKWFEKNTKKKGE